MKAPHKVTGGGGGKHHGKGPVPGKKGPAPKPAPPHHKKPQSPKKAPKPKPAPPHRKPRRLSPGSDVACCTAEAVGTLLGWDWDQVLALYWRTAADPDSGASILDTLQAANCWPAWNLLDALTCENVISNFNNRRSADWPGSVLLGCVLPEPHAIAITPDGTWWSWGRPFNPAYWPDLVIEEAWCLP